MRQFLTGVENQITAKDLLEQSEPSACGIMEREISVPEEKVMSTMRRLRSAGLVIIGTSFGKSKFKKIWFVGSGRF